MNYQNLILKQIFYKKQIMYESLHTQSLQMAWSQAPWDEAVCGFPVIQVTDMKVLGTNADADADIRIFERRREDLNAGLVSCRLPSVNLRESMLLEDHGFRFIEMVYTPEISLSDLNIDDKTEPLAVCRAGEADMPWLLDIALVSFQNERFKMDWRLNPDISDRRFNNWVRNSLHHPTQELYVIRDGSRVIAFFVTELQTDSTCYWHLNAVAPDAQGQGYGKRVWLTMLSQAASAGAHRVRSSIAARNHRVLNLYARLGFHFLPPAMTFHWVRARAP